jgi:hypothetical protein
LRSPRRCDLLLRRSSRAGWPTAVSLVSSGLPGAWVPVSVPGSCLVLARGWHGASPRRPSARRLLVLARTRHPLPWGLILSPSATLRVAGLACPGRWREDAPSPQPNTDSGCSCNFRSILEPEAPPEAIKKRYRQLGIRPIKAPDLADLDIWQTAGDRDSPFDARVNGPPMARSPMAPEGA